MKKILLTAAIITLAGCSRPMDPPVTPARPPTVETIPNSVPSPTVEKPGTH